MVTPEIVDLVTAVPAGGGGALADLATVVGLVLGTSDGLTVDVTAGAEPDGLLVAAEAAGVPPAAGFATVGAEAAGAGVVPVGVPVTVLDLST